LYDIEKESGLVVDSVTHNSRTILIFIYLYTKHEETVIAALNKMAQNRMKFHNLRLSYLTQLVATTTTTTTTMEMLYWVAFQSSYSRHLKQATFTKP
jgi:hypothetical protein